MSSKLLRVPEVSAILGLAEHRTYDLIRQGILPAVHLGRQVRIAPGELERFIQEGGRQLPGGWRREPQ